MLPPVVRPGGMAVDEIYRALSEPAERARAARAPSSPAASSRCWRSRASCAPARRCCCSTSRPRASRRSSSQQIGHVDPHAQGARLHHAAGRAELPLRRDGGRPPLRRSSTARIVDMIPRETSSRQHGQAARLPRRMRTTPTATEGSYMRHQSFDALCCGGCALLGGAAQAEISGDAVKIGVINDQSSLYADLSGMGSVDAARMAVEDFGGSVYGKPNPGALGATTRTSRTWARTSSGSGSTSRTST